MKLILLALLAALACTSITAQLPSYLPAEGLVGWWPFNGNANDESGNGNHGTVNGATLAEDRFGNVNNAYVFDGIDDFISLPSITSINGDLSRTFVIDVLINPGENGGTIISQGPELFQSSCNAGFHINATGTQADCGYSGCGVITNCSQIRHPFLFIDSQWDQLIVTYEIGGYNDLKFYIDGILIGGSISNCTQGTQYSSFNTSSLFGISIGKRNDNYFSDCTLDNIAIYNRALTQEEITALYSGVAEDNNFTANTSATLPGAISYQAVARDPQGASLSNASVQVQFTLLADSLTGASEYVETHALTTNNLGLFTTAFGAGAAVSGTFAGINWTTGNKYLNVQIDTGSGWVDIGTQQLLSVPYSLHSATAGSIKNPGLPIYPDNAAAIAGGLNPGDMYRTAAGDLKIVY